MNSGGGFSTLKLLYSNATSTRYAPPTFIGGTCSGAKPCGAGCWCEYSLFARTHAEAASKCVGCACEYYNSGKGGKGYFYCGNG